MDINLEKKEVGEREHNWLMWAEFLFEDST